MEKKVIRERTSAVRTKILETLSSKKEVLAHKDFQQIFNDKWDRVTIYRALDRLVEEGKIHKIIGLEGIIQYGLCKNCHEEHQHNHVHFSCQKCEKVVCINNSEPTIQLPKEYKIIEVQCMVSGICPECKE